MTSGSGLPLWVQAIIAILIALAAFGGLAGTIFTIRSSRAAAREQREGETLAGDHARAETWNAGYRAAAEKHLEWDAVIVSMLQGAYREINQLRELLDLEPHQPPPLPDKPPLFPGFQGKST